jgi:1-acyl-sn-glycerol-3-phosphate acyltransferase
MQPLARAWYAFVRGFVRAAFFHGTGGFCVRGLENVPRTGPLIVSPNHVSHLDPPAAACAMPRPITFMAKAELFDHRLFGALISSLGSFPVRRGEGDMEAIRTALRLLEQGKAVLMFPEGTRGDGKTLLPFNKGVGMIAKRSGAPVLPVGISGTHKRWPRGAKKPKWGRVTVAFGPPLTFAETAVHATEAENREAFARELERRILELCRSESYNLASSSKS